MRVLIIPDVRQKVIIHMLPGPVRRILHKRSLAQMVNMTTLIVGLCLLIYVGGRIRNARNDDCRC